MLIAARGICNPSLNQCNFPKKRHVSQFYNFPKQKGIKHTINPTAHIISRSPLWTGLMYLFAKTTEMQ